MLVRGCHLSEELLDRVSILKASVCNGSFGWLSFRLTVVHNLTLGPSSLAEGLLVGGQHILDRVSPGELVLNANASELAHSFSFVGMFEQPNDLGRKIGHLVLGIRVYSRVLGAESSFA